MRRASAASGKTKKKQPKKKGGFREKDTNKRTQTKVKHTVVSSKARVGLLQNDCCQFRFLFDLQCRITWLHHVIG